ncbi:MAG: cardiolipin synthase [Salinarimonadaceae bacterium]|nr:MAG: cardiolipin synthase [Salinarimonadaceae bacterium]
MEDFLAGYGPYLVFVASIVVGLAAALHAAMHKDEVRTALGWAALVLFSPFLGAFLYFVAGVNRIRRERIGRRRRGIARDEPDGQGLAGAIAIPALARLGESVSPFPMTPGNHIVPLDGGDEAYPAMVAAIDTARRSVALSSYIFDHDEAGLAVAAALARAKARGVHVKALIDGVGSRYSRPPITRLLKSQGVSCALFLDGFLGLRLPYANLRNHRKILVVDGRIGFSGGMNIRAHFLRSVMGDETARDTHFRIEGPVVSQLMSVFAEDWRFATGETLLGRRWYGDAVADGAGGAPARVVPSGPDEVLDSTHAMLIGALAEARMRVILSTPYFLPDQALVAAFAIAARRGVAVDIVIPAANNLKLVDYAMTAQLDQVIRHGCRVWRARGPFDHSKLFCVDGVWSYIGSSNLDPRSLRLNFEIDMEVHDPGLATWIETRLRARIADATRETRETLGARPFMERLRNRVVWLASPML